MGERGRPSIWAIPAELSFADVLCKGLLDRFKGDILGLARCTLLVPNNRASRAITEAFVRYAEKGLLLPRMVAIGDLELGEKLGNIFSPIGQDAAIPPAIDPMRRIFILAQIIQQESPQKPELPEALRLAGDSAAVLDQLMIEEKGAADLIELKVEADLAEHWQNALVLFRNVNECWSEKLQSLGMIEGAERRNRLLRHAAERWEANPPPFPIIAAGITSLAPAIARLQRVVAGLPEGQFVLPGLDLAMDSDVWDAIGPVGKSAQSVANHAAKGDTEQPSPSHPQYHLKALLDLMGLHRDEVQTWPHKPSPKRVEERAALVRNIFLPARLSDRWRGLPISGRRMTGVQIIEAAHQEEEAQTIALIVREALETPERRIAIVTPDRALAGRIIAHLRRWNIQADDSAGESLSITASGSFLRACARCIADGFAPVSLLALLKHPLAAKGEARGAWLDNVRKLDLVLRGPRPAPGLGGIKTALQNVRGGPDNDLIAWFETVSGLFAPVVDLHSNHSLRSLLAKLADLAGMLSGDTVWSGVAGRSAAELFASLADLPELDAGEGAFAIDPARLASVLERLMQDVAVRPPFGKHPRIAIYGLLEARLQSADMVIAAGLNEGVWPQLPAIDPWLAPMVRRELGLPSAETRIGLAAQDLAGLMGASEIVLTRAARDLSSPTIASRFLLRIKAVAGVSAIQASDHLAIARRLDQRLLQIRIEQPAPKPSRDQRRVAVAVTDLDRLRADPFAFYARKILQLPVLDAVDSEPSAAWRGTAVHDILEQWAKKDKYDPDLLLIRAQEFLAEANVHPLVITLWRPRLVAGLQWVNAEIQQKRIMGREPLHAEIWGEIDLQGVPVKGKADRIDRLADGALAIVDYKTGAPPSASQVEAGYALQLGLLGLMAQRGGFNDVAGDVGAFEYWSLAKKSGDQSFGHVDSPILEGKKRSGLPLDKMIPTSEAYLIEALQSWILGDAPFTAKLHPEYAIYTDYDQLMRLDEWYGRQVLKA
jgi:ATP-dependent helicase/nuclease subunit B